MSAAKKPKPSAHKKEEDNGDNKEKEMENLFGSDYDSEEEEASCISASLLSVLYCMGGITNGEAAFPNCRRQLRSGNARRAIR